MSPLQIRILLHYYWSLEDYQSAEPRKHAESTAVCAAMETFVREGLLKSRYTDISWSACTAPFVADNLGSPVERPIFSITDKGSAMVDHLRAVQIPVCKWVRPEELS